ncbi:MAG: PAS domain S-box protein, partial [Bacteroidota bacterium]
PLIESPPPALADMSIPEIFFHNNALGISISGPDGKIHRVNQTYADMLGYQPDELVGMSFYELTYPEDTPPNKSEVRKLLTNQADWICFEKRYRTRNNQLLWARLWVRLIYAEDETYFVATIQDISEEKKLNDQLNLRRRQLEAVFDNTLVGVAIVCPNGKVKKANPAFERILGYSEEELKKLPFRELTHPEDRGKNHELRKQVIAGKAPYYTMIKRYVRQDGATIWVNLMVTGIRDNQGNVTDLLGTVVDISEEKMAQEKLRRSERRYRLIADNTLDLISLFDPQATINFLSPSVKPLLGYQASELLDRPWLEVVHPKDRDLLQGIFAQKHLEKSEIRYRVLDKQQNIKWLESIFIPIYSPEGELIYIQGSSRDVGARLEAENALDMKIAELDRANQKLKKYISSNSELEKFAYIASHDLREPLRTIIGFTQIISKRHREELQTEAQEYLDLILNASQHMNQLVQDLLHYSRVSNESMELQELNPQALLNRLRLDMQERLQTQGGSLHIGPLPARIRAHETGIYRVFLNLTTNAFKFRRPGVEPRVEIQGSEQAGAWHFRVRDNGIGIAPRHHEQIFLLFNRLHSKNDFEGSGLGLPICSKIIDRHHGKIWLESKEGEGSTFHFSIAKSISVNYP